MLLVTVLMRTVQIPNLGSTRLFRALDKQSTLPWAIVCIIGLYRIREEGLGGGMPKVTRHRPGVLPTDMATQNQKED